MSELKVDALTGKTTANDITVTVGATVTQSLEAGLGKSWASIDQTTTDHPVYESLNVSGTFDIGNGTTKITFSNNMSNADYALSGAGQTQQSSGTNFGTWGKDTASSRQMTTQSFHTSNRNSAGTDTDTQYFAFVLHGNLA